jgi:sulfatase modifying factor 1
MMRVAIVLACIAASMAASAQECVTCRAAACADSVWLPPCGGEAPAKKAPRSKPTTTATPPTPPAPTTPSCPTGQTISDDTAGHCCWPGQVFAHGHCIGVPTSCPEGMAADAQHEKCGPAACPPGQNRTADLHCCWPAQAWSKSRKQCVGIPDACPPGFTLSIEQQTCIAPVACSGGRVNVDARHCCWPGQRLAGERCTGAPRCPSGYIENPYAETCELPAPLPHAASAPSTPAAPPRPQESASNMVRVPGGTFTMGKLGEDGPPHTVTVGAFAIDRFETTQAEWGRCVAALACRAPTKAYDPSKSLPVVNVDWAQADGYCRWRSARLPTEAEWELAARGTDGRAFPWGNNAPDCSRAIFDSCKGPKPVGGRSAGASPFGVEDMVGNVWEWVADWFDKYPTAPSTNPHGPATGSKRTVRGCSSDHSAYAARATIREPRKPTATERDLGFRCAADVR